MNFIWWLLKSSFVQSFAQKEVRHLATAAAGALVSWLVAHNASQSDAASIAEGVSAIIIGGAGYLFSRLNETNHAAVAQAAAQTGEVLPPPVAKAILAQGVEAQRTADQAQADKTQAAIAKADAGAPKTKDELLADLAAGGSK